MCAKVISSLSGTTRILRLDPASAALQRAAVDGGEDVFYTPPLTFHDCLDDLWNVRFVTESVISTLVGITLDRGIPPKLGPDTL